MAARRRGSYGGAAAAVIAAHRLADQADLAGVDVGTADEIVDRGGDRDLVVGPRVNAAHAQRLAHAGAVEAQDAEAALQHLLGGEEVELLRDDVDAAEIGDRRVARRAAPSGR